MSFRSSFFASKYSDISSISPRLLTSGNLKNVSSYIKYVSNQINQHKLVERVQELFDKSLSPSSWLNANDTQCTFSYWKQKSLMEAKKMFQLASP